MREEIQKTLDTLAGQYDPRISVFDVQIQGLEDGRLTLGGRVLGEDQLSAIRKALSPLFPDLRLDSASLRVLQPPDLPCFHVATNLTGFYEQPTFRVPLVDELTYGTELEILEERERWVFARQQDGYLGWAYQPYLARGEAPAATHLIIAPSCELRAAPHQMAEVITRLVSGTRVRVEETRGDRARVAANQTGWIPSRYLRDLASLPKSVEEKRKTLVEDSQHMIGVPYLWGGMSGNGIDCSGLARLLHRWIGVEIPRDADMQCAAARPVEPPYETGDLFFFAEDDDNRNISHVGLCLGGWTMIHSSRSRNGVYVDDLTKSNWLMDIFASAGSFLRES